MKWMQKLYSQFQKVKLSEARSQGFQMLFNDPTSTLEKKAFLYNVLYCNLVSTPNSKPAFAAFIII